MHKLRCLLVLLVLCTQPSLSLCAESHQKIVLSGNDLPVYKRIGVVNRAVHSTQLQKPEVKAEVEAVYTQLIEEMKAK